MCTYSITYISVFENEIIAVDFANHSIVNNSNQYLIYIFSHLGRDDSTLEVSRSALVARSKLENSSWASIIESARIFQS